jgi:hypothetical protein
MIKYIGELYNYRMVESSIIFKTLYLLITYGVTYDGKDLIYLENYYKFLQRKIINACFIIISKR